MSSFELPNTPTKHEGFIQYLAGNPQESLRKLVVPFNEYENKLREGFAQYRDDSSIQAPLVNAVPVYTGQEDAVRIRARESSDEAAEGKYVMPLKAEERKASGEPAIVPSFKQFKKNFNVFSESSLVDLDWNNVVAAGSSVVTSLLPVPPKHGASKRALREYYHQQLAPSSDVDLFIWGLDERAAIEKIKQIETRIRDSILSETTTIRTKNAITIASQYPIRHVQIVLRLYKSVSEILTGFDVDCSCFAYDGSQVYGTPRGIVAFMTQCNSIDLTRRSPSYESRLAKYAHRGFEIFCPFLDRDRIDPTIFERAFARTVGLARLLVLERLPKTSDREAYLQQRRHERGRPALNSQRHFGRRRNVDGNMKDRDPEDIAEWDIEGDISNYHTFTVPYGPRITPKKIERLLFSKDLLLNAEWNVKKDRKVHLHRHPCFIGDAKSVISDCCMSCPKPTNEEEEEVAAEESKHYVSGELEFMQDDPGRQAIGSFNPITTDDWLEMAYIGDVQELCQAIVDCDLHFVRDWCQRDEVSLNGRDHTGRTPLQLACQSSSPDIVKCLIDAGARIVARVADGMTALHIATARGNVEMIQALLEKSEANEEAEEERKDKLRKAKKPTSGSGAKEHPEQEGDDVVMEGNKDQNEQSQEQKSDSDYEHMDDDSEKYDMSASKDDTLTQGSFVKVKSDIFKADDALEAGEEEPDIFDVNVLAWDSPVSPLHLAILYGHVKVIELLIDRFGADVLLPIKLLNDYNRSPRTAILTLVLAAQLPPPQDDVVAKQLLDRGASTGQADLNQISAVHYMVILRKVRMIKSLFAEDGPSIKAALSHLAVTGSTYNPQISAPLLTAIKSKDETLVANLIDLGVSHNISFQEYAQAYLASFGKQKWAQHSNDMVLSSFQRSVEQPIVEAITNDLPGVVRLLIDSGADVNTLSRDGQLALNDDQSRGSRRGTSLLDLLNEKIDNARRQARPQHFKDPMELKEDSHYLGQAQAGTYQHWQLNTQLNKAKEMIESWHEDKATVQAKDLNDRRKQKDREAWLQLAKEFEELREHVVKQGEAKTFKELYPDVKEPDSKRPNWGYVPGGPKNDKEFRLRISFRIPDLHDESKKLYIKLFEAVWAGDEATVKALTLKPNGKNPPLQVAVQDDLGFSPFSIALARGNRSLAKVIIDIATAQYEPDDTEEPRRRYVIADEEDDASSVSDQSDDGVRIESELIDDVFTVENVADIQRRVGSKVQVAEMLRWMAPFWMFFDGDDVPVQCKLEKIQDFSSKPEQAFMNSWHRFMSQGVSVFYACVASGNIEAVGMMLDAVRKTPAPSNEGGQHKDPQGVFICTFDQLRTALIKGHTKLAAELIRLTGIGLPLDDLAQKSGIKETEKPKYYQGLLIYGQHKKEWAQEGGGRYRNYGGEDPNGIRPLLLELAHMGHLEPVEWILSETPRRLYHEFGKNNMEDKRVISLEKANGGFAGAVDQWLDTRRSLAVHCAILASNQTRKQKLKIIKYLIEAVPESLEAKSASGHTPLSLAYSRFDFEIAEILINAGADQTVRDAEGRNLLHLALVSQEGYISHDLKSVKSAFELLDGRLVRDMLLERCSEGPSGLTPLGRWIWRLTDSWGSLLKRHRDDPVAVYKLISKYMSGEELRMMDGSGQFVMHHCVRGTNHHTAAILEVMLEQEPQLAFLENSIGQTSIDFAEVLYVRARTANPPHMPHSRKRIALGSQSPAAVEEEETISTRIWKTCKGVAEKHKDRKRVLVSVLQASEVSKRLADITRKRQQEDRERYERPYGYGPKIRDEVDKWA